MKENKTKNWIGLFFIVIGIIWLLQNFDLIYFGIDIKKIFFSWHTFAIIIGIILISNNPKSLGGYILLVIGIISLIKHLPFIPFISFLTFKDMWPLFLILIGTWMILNFNNNKKNKKIKFDFVDQTTSSNEDTINENIQFTTMKKSLISQNFSGGKINVWFGELKLDLTQSKLNFGENILDVNVMFGALELKVPSDWKINTSISATFGGIDDKRISNLININNESTLHIKGSVVFGGCEISY